MFKRLKDIIWALLHPRYWSSIYPSCETADDLINQIIDDDLIVEADRFTARTRNGTEIWIKSYPYAYGEIRHTKALPYRRTRSKLSKYIIEKKLSQIRGNLCPKQSTAQPTTINQTLNASTRSALHSPTKSFEGFAKETSLNTSGANAIKVKTNR